MKSERSRIAAIAAAVVLSLAALLYLGGLVGQVSAAYQQWLDDGGLTGQALMGPVHFNPLHCWASAFSPQGLRGMLFVIVLGASGAAYVKLHDKFGSKDLDARNFARSGRGTYGTAGWMDDKELKSVLEVSSPAKARGTILGKTEKGTVICLPEDTRLNKHIAVFGASGTMKSRAVIRPALFQSIRRGESVIVTDPKSEIYSDTVELFRKHGYTVRVYNLLQPDLSDSWNCMFDLGGDTLMAQVLTDVIISNTKGDSKGDHFWDNGEANLLKSLILYVDQDPSRTPDERNLPAVYQMLTQHTETQLSALFDRLPLSHPAKAPYTLFSQASDNVRAGIVLGLGTRLQVLQSEAVRKITRHSDIDLAEPGKTKCIYYIILDDQNSSLEFLSSLFFAFLFIKLVRYADSTPEQRCKVPVNIILDEMNNIGVIPDFGRRLSTIRSRALQVLMACQNLPQIQNRYPNNLWAELLGNADTQLMLGCTDDVSAEFFSVRSGDMTVEVNSTMTTRQSIAIAQMIPLYRYSEGLGRRRLLTPDEVLRLPPDELLIIIRGHKILRAKKFDYTGHPYSKEMEKTSIQEFIPVRQVEDTVPPQTDTAEDRDSARNATEGQPQRTKTEHKPEQPNGPTSEIPSDQPQTTEPPTQAKPAKRRPTLYESAKPPIDF